MSGRGEAGGGAPARRASRPVRFRGVTVGGGAPVSMQSMSTLPAREVSGVLAEIADLRCAGCQIVRVAVTGEEDVEGLGRIAASSPIPVVADIHFDYRLAVSSAAAGADGLRINPGNIGGEDRLSAVLDAAGEAGIPVRIGVNAGSLEKSLRETYRADPAKALAESASSWAGAADRRGFEQVVVSIKSSDPAVTVAANLLFAPGSDLPLHIGLTEAGTGAAGAARSAAALTRMLTAGVGDTVRISLSGDPVEEVLAAGAMLSALGLRDDIPRIVSCPTCGRCHIDVAFMARRVERAIAGCGKGITVAVMGCEVNGPGEAREADVGLAGSPRGPVLFRGGEIVGRIEGDPVDVLLAEIERLTG